VRGGGGGCDFFRFASLCKTYSLCVVKKKVSITTSSRQGLEIQKKGPGPKS